MNKESLEYKIEHAIRTTLVVLNKQSIDIAVDKIKNVIETNPSPPKSATIETVTNCPTCGAECGMGNGDGNSHYYIPKSKGELPPKSVEDKEVVLIDRLMNLGTSHYLSENNTEKEVIKNEVKLVLRDYGLNPNDIIYNYASTDKNPVEVFFNENDPVNHDNGKLFKKQFYEAVNYLITHSQPKPLSDDRKICEICEKESDDLFACERCDQMICDKCQAVYNQFTQIDFNCCKSCAANQD